MSPTIPTSSPTQATLTHSINSKTTLLLKLGYFILVGHILTGSLASTVLENNGVPLLLSTLLPTGLPSLEIPQALMVDIFLILLVYDIGLG